MAFPFGIDVKDWRAISDDFVRNINSELVNTSDFDVEKYLKTYRATAAATTTNTGASSSIGTDTQQSSSTLNAIVTPTIPDPDTSKDEKSFETITRNMKTYLKRHRMREALDCFHNAVYTEIKHNGSVVAFDLVQAIAERLQRLLEYRFRTYNVCVQMLIELCGLMSDKELLIIFLAELEKDWKIKKTKKKMLEEDFDEADNDDINEVLKLEENDDFDYEECYCFLAFLEPLKIVLFRMEKGDFSDFHGAMLIIHRHLNILSLDFLNGYTNPNDDGHREIVKHKSMKRLCFTLSGYYHFIQTFVTQASLDLKRTYESETSWKGQADLLLKSLIHLFNYPLRFLVLHAPQDYDDDDDEEEAEDVEQILNHSENNPDITLSTESANFKESEEESNCQESSARAERFEVHLDDFQDSFDGWKETEFSNSKLYHDYSVQSCRKLASQYIGLVAALQPNFVTLLGNESNLTKEYYDDNGSSDMALTEDKFISGMAVIASVLAYEPEPNFVPLVYRPDYLFKLYLPLIKNLLDDPQTILVHEKGLRLMERSLKRCSDLDVEFLEHFRRFPLDRSLVDIMKYSPNRDLRLKARDMFKLLAMSLEPKAMVKYLYSLLVQPCQETGVQCLVIGMFKDQIISSAIFHHQNLHRFVRAMIKTCTKEGNINNDIFFTAINFLRFTVGFCPKSSNTIGFWDVWDFVQEQFLKPVKKRIDEYEAQLKIQLRSLTEEKLKLRAAGGQEDGGGKKKKKKRLGEIKIANSLPGDKPIDFDVQPTIEQKHAQILGEQQNLDLLRSLFARFDEQANAQMNS